LRKQGGGEKELGSKKSNKETPFFTESTAERTSEGREGCQKVLEAWEQRVLRMVLKWGKKG